MRAGRDAGLLVARRHKMKGKRRPAMGGDLV